MDWKNVKMLLVSTAALVIASQVAKRAYRYFFDTPTPHKSSENCDDSCNKVLSAKNREINDVILFSDDLVKHLPKVLSNKNLAICESRELSCYKLFKYIKSTQETLDVCMYLITSSEIAEQIIRLGQKHVLVRIIVDNEMAFTSQSQISKLQEYSFIQVQTSNKSILLHHKFCIIDGPKAIKRKIVLKSYAEKLNVHAQFTKVNVRSPFRKNPAKGFVMSGSLNWSTQAMGSNNESVIVTSHQNIVAKFEKEFESLWVENNAII